MIILPYTIDYINSFLCTLLLVPLNILDACGVEKPVVFTNSLTGELLSPNYPESYPNNADCQWHIKADDGFVVRLTFLEFDVEAG